MADWSHADWWIELETKLKTSASRSLEARFTHLIHKTLEIVEDRLKRGDPRIRPDGSIARQGVSGKDAALIQCQLFDKRALLRGDPTSRTERTSTAKDRLKGLARDMERLAATPVVGKAVKTPTEAPESSVTALKH